MIYDVPTYDAMPIKVYYISRARVTMAKKQFSTLDNEYELSFDHTTEVEQVRNRKSIRVLLSPR